MPNSSFIATQASTSEGPGRRLAAGVLGGVGLTVPLLALVTGLLGLALTLVWSLAAPMAWAPGIWLLCPGFLLLSLGGLSLGAWRLHTRLFRPLVSLEETVARVCQGEPGAGGALRELGHQVGILANLARAIDSLNEELADLYEDMDNRVARQTTRLAQKTASIKILYDVAAGINEAESLDSLLLRFLRVLKEMVNGRAATARLVKPDGSRRLVGSIGLDETGVGEPAAMPPAPSGWTLVRSEAIGSALAAATFTKQAVASDLGSTLTITQPAPRRSTRRISCQTG